MIYNICSVSATSSFFQDFFLNLRISYEYHICIISPLPSPPSNYSHVLPTPFQINHLFYKVFMYACLCNYICMYKCILICSSSFAHMKMCLEMAPWDCLLACQGLVPRGPVLSSSISCQQLFIYGQVLVMSLLCYTFV